MIGIELSHIACKDFFSEINVKPDIEEKDKFTIYKRKNIKLFCGDFFDLTPNKFSTIHAIYDCKALIALPSELRIRYVNHIIHCVGKNIKILLITRDSDCKVNPPPYPVNKFEVTTLYSPYFVIRLLKSFNVTNIPEKLITKGYKAMTESVYLISGK